MRTAVFRRTRGFSLVEVTLAIGIAAFCLLPLFGLLPLGLKSNRSTIEQTAAASLAASVVADLRATPTFSAGATPAVTPASPHFVIPIPTTATSTSPTQAQGQVYTLFLKEDGSMAQDPAAVPKSAINGWDIDYNQSPRYRVTLVFTPPSGNGQLTATAVRVLVTWPAVADPKNAMRVTDTTFPSRFSDSFETVTSLTRH